MCMYCEIPLQSTVFHQNELSFAKLPHGKPATENRQRELMGPCMSPFAAHMLCTPSGAEPRLTIWLKGKGRLPVVPMLHTWEKLLSNAFALQCCTSLHPPRWQAQQPSPRISFPFASSQQSHQTGAYYPAWKQLLLSSRWRTEVVSLHTFLNGPQWENSLFLFQGIKWSLAF